MPKIAVIDNYDSFTYNLVQYLGVCGASVTVFRNDCVTVAELDAMGLDGILLSPGPCTPRESGVCLPIISAVLEGTALSGVRLFGVCLGFQAMCYVAGAEVRHARTVKHGKSSLVSHDGLGVFAGLSSPLSCVRYHSLAVEESTIPSSFVVTSRSLDDDEVMGVRHVSLPMEGVLFHPESVLTQHGVEMVANAFNLR